MKALVFSMTLGGLISLLLVAHGEISLAHAQDEAEMRLMNISEKSRRKYKEYKSAVRLKGMKYDCACVEVEDGPEFIPVWAEGRVSRRNVKKEKLKRDSRFLHKCLEETLSMELAIREDCRWKVVVAFDKSLMFQRQEDGLVLFPVVSVFVLDTKAKLIVGYYALGQKGSIDQDLLDRVCAASAQFVLRPPKEWWLEHRK